MNSSCLIYNDCCLLSNICWNSQRISYLFARRFRSNSSWTSFDFKFFLPEQPSNNTKISRSLLKFYSLKMNLSINDAENMSSDDLDDNLEEVSSPKAPCNSNDDNHLDKLAEWEPGKFLPTIESDDDEEEVKDNNKIIANENTHTDSMNLSTEISSSQVEDLFITYINRPVKNEPMVYDNNDFLFPQLDGLTDFSCDTIIDQTERNSKSQNLNKIITKIKSKSIEINQNRKMKKNISAQSKSINSCHTNKTKRLNNEFHQSLRIKQPSSKKKRKRSTKEHAGKTLEDYGFKVIKRPLNNNDNQQKNQMKSSRKRSENYFNECIIFDDDDDDDIKEIEQQSYSIPSNIHTREKLLDHTIHSSTMRTKWLHNLGLLLLEHISICHQKNIRPSNSLYLNSLIKCEPMDNPSLSYYIDPSLISIIIENFLKMFIIRNSSDSEKEFSFYQFGFTAYLRYLLIELPTYNHIYEINCSQCDKYSSILIILFDLLFDLIEYDICKITNKEIHRSSLIEDDYFNKLIMKKSNKFDRIKLIIYFIELIEIHRNKCQNKKVFNFHKNENIIFQWIEGFIRYIIYHQENNLINEKLSICFNVMELCILFVNEKENRIRQMALFLTKLCEENSTYLNFILFNKDLLIDIRLLLINELISNKFDIKLFSINDIENLFHHIQMTLTSPNSIDEMSLLLIRSLFDTYADFMIDMKNSNFVYSTYSEQITSILRTQLETIHLTLANISHDSNDSQQIERMVILFRLLKYKWKKL
ncbi:unnamed protein product [Adineta steineri]|uniref:Uncharacterized protein n=1 Tax=Adineta steineri TaxID=433720 RepID=A0A815S752_9BILA|nr:unnamed protein product [Adineta steineri]CAF1640157.1 unnamed protein product [Adineta steineri]